MKFIKWFKEINKKDIPKAGGKGANLGELVKIGLPVPPGFVITSSAYDLFLKKHQLIPKIKKYLNGLKPEETKKIAVASKKIKEELLSSSLPQEIIKEVSAAYEKLGKDVLVAIRSSATAEDLPTASFAGQQATFLNIKGARNVTKAVLKCFASLFEPRAIFYRLQNNFDHLKVKIAVPIQVMVQSEKSGVIFTVDPLTSDKTRITIEAGYGLGEAIVSGSITPDRYLVDKKELKILGREIQKQKWQIKRAGNKNKHIQISKRLQEAQKISDQEILELAELAKKIESHYKHPQDIEWAIESNKVWLLQTRPVTALKRPSTITETVGEKKLDKKMLLKGLGASIGIASGPVVIIYKPSEIDKIKQGDILVAEMTNPSYVPAMKKAKAIVTDTGGQTSHAAIVSRELGIPCVVGTGQATSTLKNGQMITVNGLTGEIYKGIIEVMKEEGMKKEIESRKAETAPITATKIYVNLGEPSLAQEVAKEPVDGVGLLRAEFMIAEIGEHPRYMANQGKGKEFAKKLSDGIKTIASAFHPRPIVYRATDFKTNEYKNLKGGEKFEPNEANPMLGYRGASRYILEPDLFKLELWALRRAQEQFGLNNIWLMIPFVRTVSEIEKITEIMAKQGMYRTGDFKLWMMVEVPSNVFMIEEFCKAGIDGVSIGSNDLTQLILGIDRDNEKLASEFDERNEAVLRAIKTVIKTCRKHHITSSICGQAPSVYPEYVEMLVEAGITSISVNPDAIYETRKLVSSVEKKVLLDKIKEIEGLSEEMM